MKRLSLSIVMGLLIVLAVPVASQATAITVTFPSSTAVFTANTWQSVGTVSGVTPSITGGTGDTFRVIVSANNSGVLRLATTTGITASTSYNLANFNAASNGLGTISFEGPVADVSAALASLQFKKASAGDSTITLDVTEGTGLVFGNHYYQVITTQSAITWADAYKASLTYAIDAQGGGAKCQGYLAAITTANEQTFAFDKVRTTSWIALADEVGYVNTAIASYNAVNEPDLSTYANQAASEGKFYWVAGPERGTQVTTNNAQSGQQPPLVSGVYANWNNGEPNNSGTDEHATQMLSDGKWNDLKHDSTGSNIRNYIIEYGGIRVTGSHQTNVANVDVTNQAHLGTKAECVPAAVGNAITRTFTARAANVPGAPTSPSATAAIQSVNLSWTAPNSDGGSAITGYRIDISSDNGSNYTTAIANTSSSATSASVANLVPGTSYVFKIYAINAVGTGTGSTATTSVTVLAGVPGAPRNILVQYPYASSVNISWDAPTSDGGSAITSYVVEYQNGGSWLPLTPTGRTAAITNGSVTINDRWNLRVAAVNATGQSVWTNFQNEPPTPYSGPIITSFSKRELFIGDTTSVVLKGLRLDLVTELSIGTTKLSFTKSANGEITVTVPSFPAGTYDLQVKFGSAVLTHLAAFSFSVKPELPQSAIQPIQKTFTGFPGDKARLSSQSRVALRNFLNSIPNATKMTCIGSTSGRAITAADTKLAMERASEACKLVKQLRPDLQIELQTNPSAGLGPKFRSVTLVGE